MSRNFIFTVLLALWTANLSAQGNRDDYARSAALREKFSGKVYKETIRPHWSEDGASLRYANKLPGGKTEVVLVDLATGERRILDDKTEFSGGILKPNFHVRKTSHTGERMELAFENTLSKPVELFWLDFTGQEKNYGKIEPGETRNMETFEGHVWAVRDSERKLYGVYEGRFDTDRAVIAERDEKAVDREKKAEKKGRYDNESPNGLYSVSVRDDNLLLHWNGGELDLTRDGGAEDRYEGPVLWSPDGKFVIARKTRPAEKRKVFYVESSPEDQLQPKLHDYEYLKPGDRVAVSRPVLFRVKITEDGTPNVTNIPIDDGLFENPWSVSSFSWAADGSRFFFLYNRRGHQVVRYLSVQAESGKVRIVAEETSETFVSYTDKIFTHRLDESDELVWMSQRDGWNHLYLIDTKTGETKNRITAGSWVVRSVEKIDAEKRIIWFYAGGVHADQDPYHLHYCRVDFDGTNFCALTQGDGTHRIQHSPDRKYFIDTFSRVDMQPRHELRCTESGRLICELENADHSELIRAGWKPPERFTAKGRDGATEIYGIIVRPTNFDSEKRYPVIEQIYAGPHGSFVPKDFQVHRRMNDLAELGFILVQIDGMGTNHRSKVFHDVCWKNLGDSGFSDRIAWLQAAAMREPAIDLDRVGIYGGSAGGQSSTRALLAHGDFYKVAVSDCGCHDNRMDKIWWNEQWMGWPVGPHYEEQSNVTQAHRLTGKLLLTVGEADRNVDPASTMQLVNALIEAGKDFELLIMTGQGHGSGEHPYADRRRKDFFVRHLLGVEPRWEPESPAKD